MFRSKSLTKAHEGFYISNELARGNKKRAMLIIRRSDDDTQRKSVMMFGEFKPHTGSSGSRSESLEYIQRNYDKATAEEVKDAWDHQYDWSVKNCKYVAFAVHKRNLALICFRFAATHSTVDIAKRLASPTVR